MRRPGEGGQATVEMALCLPLLALVLAALFEASMIAADQVRVWHAAREGARHAAVDPSLDATHRAAEGVGLRPLRIEVTPESHHRVAGEPLTVRVSYEPDGRVPLIGRLFGGIELRAAATMRIEQP